MLNHFEYNRMWWNVIRSCHKGQLRGILPRVMERSYDPVPDLFNLNLYCRADEAGRLMRQAVDAYDAGLVTRFDIKRWIETALED